MTEEIKNKIIDDLKNSKMRQVDIAEKYGVSQGAVSAIKSEFKIIRRRIPTKDNELRVQQILYDIANSDTSISQIAEKYGVSKAYITNLKYDILRKFSNDTDEANTKTTSRTITPKPEETESVIDEFIKDIRNNSNITSTELFEFCQKFSTLSGLNVDYIASIDDTDNVIFNNKSYIRIYNDKFNIIYNRFNTNNKEYVKKGK